MSVKGSPSSVIVRPIADGSPPRCRCQKPADATTTVAGSPSPNVRPTIAGTPRTVNSERSALTVATCSGSAISCRFWLYTE
jgi:hypothetical protein